MLQSVRRANGKLRGDKKTAIREEKVRLGREMTNIVLISDGMLR
jgi:hypothetical protein